MTFGRRFLREPERRPESGTPRGAARLDVRIAGERFRITGLDADGRERLALRFRGFEDADASAAVIDVAVASAPDAAFVAVDTRGWDYDLDLAPERDEIRIAGLKFLARVSRAPVRAALLTSADAAELPGVVENLLRLLVAYALVARGGALVHGAGVARGSRAGLFFGVSGAGKTTLSRLAHAAGRRILSDDMVALEPCAGRVRLRAIPFAGDFRETSDPEELELEAFYRLRKAPHHALRPLGPAEALAALLVCTPFVNRDPWIADRLLGNLDALLRLAPAKELAFAPEPGVLDLLGAAS